MRETSFGNIEFTDDTKATTGYNIGSFGIEGTGKTFLPLTGPEVIAMVPLESKSFATIEKVTKMDGYTKRVIKPKDPAIFMVNPRKAKMMEAVANEAIQAVMAKTKVPAEIKEAKQKAEIPIKQFYRDHVDRVTDAIYALLENKDTRVVAIDKWSQLVTWIEFAVNGLDGHIITVNGKMIQDKKESNQEIYDYMNDWAKYGKAIVYINGAKDEYENDNKTGRLTHEGYKYLGSHTNVLIEHTDNKRWNPDEAFEDDDNKNWHFSMSIRKCQKRPELEGPDGKHFLKDEFINMARLITAIDSKANPSDWM